MVEKKQEKEEKEDDSNYQHVDAVLVIRKHMRWRKWRGDEGRDS